MCTQCAHVCVCVCVYWLCRCLDLLIHEYHCASLYIMCHIQPHTNEPKIKQKLTLTARERPGWVRAFQHFCSGPLTKECRSTFMHNAVLYNKCSALQQMHTTPHSPHRTQVHTGWTMSMHRDKNGLLLRAHFWVIHCLTMVSFVWRISFSAPFRPSLCHHHLWLTLTWFTLSLCFNLIISSKVISND